MYNTTALCRFCEEEEETFDRLVNECLCFCLDQCNIIQNQPINGSLDWTPKQLLDFANIDTIKDALSYDPYSPSDW